LTERQNERLAWSREHFSLLDLTMLTQVPYFIDSRQVLVVYINASASNVTAWSNTHCARFF